MPKYLITTLLLLLLSGADNLLFAQNEAVDNIKSFQHNSRQIAKHLYDISSHPKIKGGELYVTYFSNMVLDGDTVDAVGIFKSETKETYLKV